MLPGQRHRLVRTPGLEMWVVTLRAGALDPSWVPALAAAPAHVVAGEELIELDRLLAQVAQDSDDPATYNAGIAYALRRAWRASRSSPAGRHRAMHPAVARALLVLREGDASVSLPDLAAAAGVAAPYLSRLLVEYTGRNFVDWRNRVRLDRFIRAYHREASLLAAATSAGFGSYARFHRAFTEVIGCTPSEWAKRGDADRNDDVLGPMPGAGDYGIPGAAVAGGTGRERWLALVPLVAPVVPRLLGSDFLERVLAAIPEPRPSGPPPAPVPADALAEAEARLVSILAADDPAQQADLADLLRSVDFAAVQAEVLGAFRLLPDSLFDAVTAVLGMAWTAAHRTGDAGVEQVEALAGQVRDALRTRSPVPGRATEADAAVAFRFHFVVLYQALLAARAAGDPRALDRLGSAVSAFSGRAFGGDLAGLALSSRGLVRPGRP